MLIFSCKEKCIVDKKFKSEFDNCIYLVKQINSEGYSSDLYLRTLVYECLFAVTGYEGHADKSNEPHCFYPYNDSIDYIDFDIKEWLKWYEFNKCSITLNMADSLILNHSVTHGIPELKWPAKAL